MQGAGLELCLRFTFHVSCAANFRFNCAAVVLQEVGKVLFFKYYSFVYILGKTKWNRQSLLAGQEWAQ